MFATLSAFGMNGANAIDEMECDVTPGMTWDGNSCVTEDAKDSCSSEDVLVDEGDGEQACAPKSDVTTEGNKTVYNYVVYAYGIDKWYNGMKVYFGDKNLLPKAREVLKQKYNINLIAIHGMCGNNEPQTTLTYARLIGDPHYSKKGENCWCRIKTDK